MVLQPNTGHEKGRDKMGKKNLGSVKDLLDDVQLARVDDLRSRSKSEKPNIIGPVMVYAKAFEDLETGEMFFVRHVGFGAGSDGRGPGGMGQRRSQQRPARFLGDALVDDVVTKGWPGDPARQGAVTFLPYGTDTLVQ